MARTVDEDFLPVNSKELILYKEEVKRMSKNALLLEIMRIHDSISWVSEQQKHKTRTTSNIEHVLTVWNTKLKIVSDLLAEKELFE